ncbi:Kinase [Hexamita inflata]|uniref:non-specific serine/threonine protein kinase n=1 Tax=Hexamita inflata TaxID=28002 RepID=A0ABP1I2V0_9EUKA
MSHSSLLDFEIMQQIGRGTFGVVYKCKRRKDGGIYVLKELKLSGCTGEEVQTAINECNILAAVDSDYVVRYYDSFIDNSTQTLWLVMEYAAHGTLRDIIIKSKDYISEQDAWYYITQMILGIASLHSSHIIHRDIKSLNVFVADGSNGQKYALKFGDMGVSKQLNSTIIMSQTLVGSPYYLSPEICRSEKYNIKSDIWALGVTFYEMLNKGKHPFLAQNQAALLVNIIKGKYKPLPAQYSQQLIDLVRWCLQQDPSKRPDVFSLLAIPPVQQTIKQYNLKLPPAVEQGAKEAMQRLSRIKSSEISRSRLASERSTISTQSSTKGSSYIPQRQIPVPQSQPIVQKQHELQIDSDIIMVDRNDIHEYKDDFDDEVEDNQSAARPETAAFQQKLQELLMEDAKLLQKFEDTVREISSYQVQQMTKDNLINFFVQNDNLDEKQINDFVFKLIPLNKIGIVQYFKQYAKLLKQRQQVAIEINKIMLMIKG